MPWSSQVKAYCLLMKPGILFGNAVTASAGFALASRDGLHLELFLMTLIGLLLIVASGCTFNNWIDRHADQKMLRTQHRALATGQLKPSRALVFGSVLGLLGACFLGVFVNALSLYIALLGFVIYVLFYSFLKYRTVHGTLIGSLAGAIPPVVGYTAVSSELNLAALLLFLMIVLWQMPHFYAIAMYRLKKYAAACIPVLPITKGIRTAKIHMLLYVVGLTLLALLLPLFGFVATAYSAVAALVGAGWLFYAIRGFTASSDKAWARKMFLFSLVAVMALSAAIPLTT